MHTCTDALTQVSAHEYTFKIKNRGLNGGGKQQRERRKHGMSIVFEEKSSEVGFERAQRGFPLGKKGKVIPCSGADDRKGTGANTGKFGMKTLQADIYYTLITLTRKEKSDLNFSKVL